MKIINGRRIADQILLDLKKEIEEKKIKGCLAVVLIGGNPASHLYTRKKEEAARKIDLQVRKYLLPEQISEKEVLGLIDSLNKDRQINGILVQLPLPNHLAVDKIIQTIQPIKDVDGFVKNSPYQSPFILAIGQALEATGEDLSNKQAVALVNSKTFARKLKSHFSDLEFIQDLGKADIVISALGRPQYIKGAMIKNGAVLIDGGISRLANKTVGDIDRESVQDQAAWLSPVPGGLGPLTVAFVMKNLVFTTIGYKEA